MPEQPPSKRGLPRMDVPRSPEQRVINIVQSVDQTLTRRLKEPRLPGNREEACTYSVALVDYAFKKELTQPNERSASVKTFQSADIHEFLGETDDSLPFPHGFSTVKIDNEQFLVDLTYCQFMSPNGPIHNGIRQTEIESSTNQLANVLLKQGYVRLTNDVMQEFLRITTLNKHPDYRLNATLETLDLVKGLTPISDLTFTEEELHEDLYPGSS